MYTFGDDTESVFPVLGAIIDIGDRLIDAVVPEEKGEIIPPDPPAPGQEFRDLKNKLDLGQINMAEYQRERNKLLGLAKGTLENSMDTFGQDIDYCSSCHAPLPNREVGECEYCGAHYDKSEGIALAKAIEATDFQ